MKTFKNHIHVFGIKVPERQRYLLVISMLLLIVGIWYLFVYQTYSHAVSQTSLAIKQLQDKQTVLATTEKAVAEQRKFVEEKHNEFINFKDQQTKDAPSIFALVQHNGLHMTSYAPEPVTDQGWYATTKIRCNLSGTFDQIISFVDACSKQKQLIGLSTFSITKRDDGLECACVVEAMKIKQESGDEKK